MKNIDIEVKKILAELHKVIDEISSDAEKMNIKIDETITDPKVLEIKNKLIAKINEVFKEEKFVETQDTEEIVQSQHSESKNVFEQRPERKIEEIAVPEIGYKSSEVNAMFIYPQETVDISTFLEKINKALKYIVKKDIIIKPSVEQKYNTPTEIFAKYNDIVEQIDKQNIKAMFIVESSSGSFSDFTKKISSLLPLVETIEYTKLSLELTYIDIAVDILLTMKY